MIEKALIPKSGDVPRKLKNLVIDSCKRHAWNIGCSHFVGTILYMNEDCKSGEDGRSDLVAEAVVDRRYLRVTFKLYPVMIETWKKEGDEYIERIISHEMAHVVTQHLYEVATARYCDDGEMKDAWEALTEVVGQLSLKLNTERQKAR